MERILIIDDDVELCDLLAQYFSGEGYQVELVHDGKCGLDSALAHNPAIIVLDIMLPEISGLEVLRGIRRSSNTPVIILTAKGDLVDRIIGLEIGADDYLSKPFYPRELAARIRAVLRRTNTSYGVLNIGKLEIDTGMREARVDGNTIEFTTLEYDLLEALTRKSGQVVSRDDLSSKVLGREFSPLDRSIDMHISNIRKKLISAGLEKDPIKTLRGIGYMYINPDSPRI
jgi:two-component system response regulator CpxR